MPLGSNDILGMIDDALARHGNHTDTVSVSRRRFLIDLRATVRELGVPLPRTRRLNACIMPFIFQELNNDGYDWSSRTSALGQLEDLVDVDVAIWSNGSRRSEMTEVEYRAYWKFCITAIERRSKQ